MSDAVVQWTFRIPALGGTTPYSFVDDDFGEGL
jgi:hypothetical protein